MNAAFAHLKALLSKSSFARNVAVLAGGTAVGQAIVVLASPILTRLYTPEDFGVLAVYSSLLGILSTVAALRYELAIPLPEKDEDAAALVALSLAIVLGMSLLVGLGVWLWGDQVARWVNAQTLRPHLWLLPVGMTLVGGYQVFNYWAIRKCAFERIARSKLNQGLGNALTQLALGVLGSGSFGLLVGDIVGRTAVLSTIASGSWKELADVSPETIRRVARRYRRFPQISSFSSLINSAGLQLPSLLLAAFYGPHVTGWFLLVQRVMGVPVTLIGQATAQVYMSEASRLRREQPEAMRFLFIKTAQRLFVLGTPPFLLIGLMGPWVFVTAFGPQWETSGRFMQMLFLMYLADFVVYPLSQTLTVLERQGLQMGWDIGRLLAVVGGVVGAYIAGGSYTTAIVSYGIAMLGSYLVLLVVGYRILVFWRE